MLSRTVLVLLLAPTLANATGQFRITVVEPSGVVRSGWPVTSGVPFGIGELISADAVSLRRGEAGGPEVPLQTEILSRWPDSSIRWLLLDFQVDLQPAERKEFTLRFGKGVTRLPIKTPITISDGYEGLTVNTGPLKVHLDRDNFRPLQAVWLDRNNDGSHTDNERVTSSDSHGLVLIAPDGSRFHAHQSRMRTRVEQRGPLRACIRLEGQHQGKNGHLFRYVARLHLFRGRPFVRFDYTFINDHTPQLVSAIKSLTLGVSLAGDAPFLGRLQGQRKTPSRLFQLDDRQFHLDGQPAGRHAAGWVSLAGSRGEMAVGIRHFWQNWPKGLAVHDKSLHLELLPAFPEGTYDGRPIREECMLYYYLRKGQYTFKIGASRTHEFWARFSTRPTNPARNTSFFRAIEQRLLAQVTPARVHQTHVLGNIPVADTSRFAGYDKLIDGFLGKLLAEQVTMRQYGLLNFGDWYSRPWDSWGNLEYDTARCLFTQYLRSGDRHYFDRAEIAAQHFVDVDTCHAVNVPLRKYGGSWQARNGRIWAHSVGHTGGYYGRYDGERYHDEAPLVMKGAYQLGLMDDGHVWIGGVFDHYSLTGNRRAYEVGKMATDAMAQKIPTRYTDHLRGIGWPLNMMMDAWQTTGDQVYLTAATKQWRRLRKHLDPAKGWVIKLAYGHCNDPSDAGRCRGQNSYMLALTLSSLARYHQATGDPEVLAGLTAGIDQLIRECWDEKNQSFYLTSCTHARSNPPPKHCSATCLIALAFAHEYAQTGNKEHRRIFRAALKTTLQAGLKLLPTDNLKNQVGYGSMMFLFTPHGLSLLED